MKKTGAEGAIPRDVALQLCADIRQENRNKWYSFTRWQCWGCFKFNKGDPEKVCLSGKPGYRGCYLVNGRYARVLKKADEWGMALTVGRLLFPRHCLFLAGFWIEVW